MQRNHHLTYLLSDTPVLRYSANKEGEGDNVDVAVDVDGNAETAAQSDGNLLQMSRNETDLKRVLDTILLIFDCCLDNNGALYCFQL